jgi:hypothetical protein
MLSWATVSELMPWLTGIAKNIIDLIPPWIVRLVEKWLFGWFYLIFSCMSWILGGGLWRWILHNALFLVGAYYVASIAFDIMAHWAIERAESAELSRNPAIKDLMMRACYPPFSRALFNKYRGWKVRQIIVGRHSVGGFVTRLIDFFSAGVWSDIRDRVYKTGLNHTLLLLVLEGDGGGYKVIRVEKNNVVAISDEFKIHGGMTIRNVSGSGKLGLTLEEFLQPAHHEKEKYINYRIMDNNCQGFVAFLLKAHGLLSKELEEFIIQDLEHLNKSLPSFALPVTEVVMFVLRLWSYIVYVN